MREQRSYYNYLDTLNMRFARNLSFAYLAANEFTKDDHVHFNPQNHWYHIISIKWILETCTNPSTSSNKNTKSIALYKIFLLAIFQHHNEKILRLLLHLKPNLHDMTRATDLSNDPYQTRIIQIKINLFWQINSFLFFLATQHDVEYV